MRIGRWWRQLRINVSAPALLLLDDHNSTATELPLPLRRSEVRRWFSAETLTCSGDSGGE